MVLYFVKRESFCGWPGITIFTEERGKKAEYSYLQEITSKRERCLKTMDWLSAYLQQCIEDEIAMKSTKIDKTREKPEEGLSTSYLWYVT